MLSKEALIFFLLVISTLLLGETGAVLILIVAIFTAPMKTDYLIKALFASYAIFYLNPVLFSNPNTALVSLLRQALLLSGAIFCAYKQVRKNTFDNRILWLSITCISFIILSGVYGYSFSISLLKISLFFLGVYVTLTAFTLSKKSSKYWLSWIYTFFLVIAIGSIPTYFIPSIGMGRYSEFHLDSGIAYFQGIANHPQTFAVSLAIPIAIIVGKFVERKGRILDVILLSILLFCLFASKGRTGLVALATSIILSFFLSILNKPFRKIIIRWFYSLKNRILLVVSIIVIAATSNFTYPIIQDFIFKRENVTNTVEAFEASRLSQILKMTKNIEENWTGGIGFGLPSDLSSLESNIVRDPLFNIPISAPTEKGFLPIAVIEENGVVGGLVFLVFMIVIVRSILAKKSLVLLLASLAAIMGNFGEMMFFSFGGMGLMMWIVIGICSKKR